MNTDVRPAKFYGAQAALAFSASARGETWKLDGSNVAAKMADGAPKALALKATELAAVGQRRNRLAGTGRTPRLICSNSVVACWGAFTGVFSRPQVIQNQSRTSLEASANQRQEVQAFG